MKNSISNYKRSMVAIFKSKYRISEFEARRWINEYDFDRVLKGYNYIALHDDPEIWVDAIYQWISYKERSENYRHKISDN